MHNSGSKHINFVKTNLGYMQRAGIKVVRVFLLGDGRTVFDKDGHVTGYNCVFWKDVDIFLDLAHQAGIKVEFVLFDYLIAGKAELVDSVWIRGREGVITDENLRKEFINKFLTPFLKDFGDHPALAGFDIINEPEWILSQADGGDWESVDPNIRPENPIPGQKLKDFINDCINQIYKETPGKFATVGVSCKFIPLVSDLKIDYFALHHYPWMGELKDCISLLPKEHPKPWSLEEYPTRNTPISIPGYLDLVLEAGGSGALLWNLHPGIDDSTFRNEEREVKLQELRKWVDTHTCHIYKVNPSPDIKANNSDGPLTISQEDFLTATVSLNPGCHNGENADWWLVADIPFSLYYYNAYTGNCQPDISFTFQGPLFNLNPVEVLKNQNLREGEYKFYFGVDLNMNGSLDVDQLYYDSVEVIVKSSQ